MEYILYINNMSSLSVVGSLFATLSSTELLFTACSQLIYGVVYKWSVSFFPRERESEREREILCEIK
jgi:hypothetical protein